MKSSKKTVWMGLLLSLAACSSQELSYRSYDSFNLLVSDELKDISLYSDSNQWFAELISCRPHAKGRANFKECVDAAFDRGRGYVMNLYNSADKTQVDERYVRERIEGVRKASQDFKSWSKFGSNEPMNDDEMVAAVASLYFYEQIARKAHQENRAAQLFSVYTESVTRYNEILGVKRHVAPGLAGATPHTPRTVGSESRIRRLESLTNDVK